MGAGASAGIAAACQAASDEELKAFVAGLPADERQKLVEALEKRRGETTGTPSPAIKALIVATSAAKLGDHTTGAWSEEICGPYFAFKDGGCNVTVCSIGGGDVPIDAASLTDNFKTENDRRMIETGSGPLKGTSALASLDVLSYDIIFFAGGHGTCVDFPTDAVGSVAAKAYSAGKVVAAVCHGPMALVSAKTADGEPLVKGKKVSVFTDAEEGQVNLTEKVPFLLEAKMKELGATIRSGDPWTDTATQDGKLVTGQNPQSSVSCAKLALSAVRGVKALIVATSVTKMGDHMTGAWSEEICGPYYVFKDGGCDVTVCSISGGDVPIDASSLSDNFKTENDRKMIEAGSGPLKGTAALANLDVLSYDIIFFAGGHGTCVDYPTDAVGDVVSKACSAGKIVAAVCHGPMALVNAKTADGEPLVKGKKISAFTDVEEGQVGLTEKVPFLLEAKLKELGATIQSGDPWSDTTTQDGKLVTGQNPQSSVSCAKLALSSV
mmetsp:Transcript_78698/g.218616  ORF Transcript_78698/g.218616 Transcript_78698/m.218616 type:complete len:495 (-) Transcript_78698:118-1602(-)